MDLVFVGLTVLLTAGTFLLIELLDRSRDGGGSR